MNAVTKTFGQRTFISKPIFAYLPVPKLRVFILAITVLITAFAVVYIKDLNRRLFINYQDLQQTSVNLSVNHSKLLLEEGALSAQARVQRIAARRLGMTEPGVANFKIIKL